MAKKVIYDKEYFKQRDHLNSLIATSIYILCKKNRIKTALDVGCGTGRLVNFLNQKKIVTIGIDNQPEAIKYASKINSKNSIIKGSASNLPFKAASFDLIIAISTIEHLTPHQNTLFLTKSYEILKDGGLIFLITPNFSSPFRYIFGKKWFGFKDPTHTTFFTPNTISKKLNDAKYKNITFRFETQKNLEFDWYLPDLFPKLPTSFKNFVNYLLITSPLSIHRDSIWVSAQK